MKIGLIHLSDIHFTKNDAALAARLGTQISNATRDLCHECDGTIIAITGDVADSATAEEYVVAREFVNVLKEGLAENCGKPLIVSMCPGNHDFDDEKNTKARDRIVKSLTTEYNAEIDASEAEILTIPQAAFFNFARDIGALPDSASRLCWRQFLKVSDKTLGIYVVNSACLSGIPEKKGSLMCPYHDLSAVYVPEDELSIVMMHHPNGWLSNGNANATNATMNGIADVILTGHEHTPSSYTRSSPEERNHYFEGAVLNSPHEGGTPSFNTALLDLAESKQRVSLWQLSDGIFMKTRTDAWQPFHKNKRRHQSHFTITPAWSEFLSDPGAGYSHRNKEQLSIDDIYVLPDVEHEDRNGKITELRNQDIYSFILEERHVVILGPEMSGRTSLAKRLFSHLHSESQKVPLYIDASSFPRFQRNKLEELLLRRVTEQYDVDHPERFLQIAPDEKVIIIDNWERCVAPTPDEKNKILEYLSGLSSSIVVMASNESQFENIVMYKNERSVMWSYRRLSVLDFGHRLRHMLIRKWYEIGSDDSIDEAEMDRIVDTAERYINSAIEHGLAKPYAPIIFMLLQVLETKRPLNTTSSSFVYLYESVIKDGLIKGNAHVVSFDAKMAIAARIAHELYTTRQEGISEVALNALIDELSDKGGVKIKSERAIKELVDARILVLVHDVMRFRYSYAYYYFCALHLHQHISDSQIFGIIAVLSERLYNETDANILLYLTYLNKDQRILDSVVKAAGGMFSGYESADLDKIGDSLQENVLVEHLIIPDEDVRRNQDHENEKIDAFRRENERSGRSESADAGKGEKEEITSQVGVREQRRGDSATFKVQIKAKNSDDVAIVKELNAAAKTIQIMGQLIRSFQLSMSAEDKERLAEECYNLGLRMASCLGDIFRKSKAEMIKYFVENDVMDCKTLARDNTAKAIETAGNIYCQIAFGLTFNAIKQVADSVGCGDYMPIYDAIIKRNKTSVAYSIIDAAIRLDHEHPMPKEAICKLGDSLRKTGLSYYLLRKLVYQRLLLHHLNVQTRQAMCQKFDIMQNLPRMIVGKRPER